MFAERFESVGLRVFIPTDRFLHLVTYSVLSLSSGFALPRISRS